MLSVEEFASRHVTHFNDAVSSGDYSTLLADFTPDAVARFENVPGAGVLEFRGLDAITDAYASQPPDDLIDLIGEPSGQNGELVVRFAWRSDGTTGTLRLERRGDSVAAMTVTFD